jgi:transposase
MKFTNRINDNTWSKIYDYLQGFLKDRTIYIRSESSCRKFVEAVYFMARSGLQWRLLPAEFGHWNTVYRRFADWSEKGIWYKMFYYFQNDSDMEYIMIDSTILRAHACASGGSIKKKVKNRV